MDLDWDNVGVGVSMRCFMRCSMRSSALAAASISAMLLASGMARADGMPAPQYAAPGIGIDWEVGARYWYSTGRYQKSLFTDVGPPIISRLTYDDLTASAAEAYFRGDVKGGLFIKGIVGGGSIT